MHLKLINQLTIKSIEHGGLYLYMWCQRYLVHLEVLRMQ
jgi:hypothetical protein